MMNAALLCSSECDESMESKNIKVSKKRQITIPQKYYEKLGIEDEVECILADNSIILVPASRNNSNNDFSEFILEDLIKQGYSGGILLEKFKEMKGQIRPALERLIEETEELIRNRKGTGEQKMNDIFGSED